MFDLGIQELIVIFVVALLVFGPKRLPELARTMGKGFGQLRKAMFDIKSEIEKEMDDTGIQLPPDLPKWKKEAIYGMINKNEKGEEGLKGLEKEEYQQKPKPPTVNEDPETSEETSAATEQQTEPEPQAETGNGGQGNGPGSSQTAEDEGAGKVE